MAQAARIDEAFELRAIAGPDVDAVSACMASRSIPSASRRPVNRASPSRSSALSRRGSTAVDRPTRNPIDVLLSRRHILPADTAARRVRPAAEAEPLAIGPVFEVVPGLAARPRDVRDLVLLVSGAVEALHRRQIHRRRIVVGRLRPFGAGHLVLERRVRIHLEQVERQVLGRQGDRLVDRLEPLARPAVPAATSSDRGSRCRTRRRAPRRRRLARGRRRAAATDAAVRRREMIGRRNSRD